MQNVIINEQVFVAVVWHQIKTQVKHLSNSTVCEKLNSD